MKRIVMTEQSMQIKEAGIPRLAGEAVKLARSRALSSGGKVTEAVGGKLVETSADGGQRVIRNLPARVPVVSGSKRILKRTP